MEDARKEFQIFMSPTRDSHDRRPSPSKQRLVPVISKFFLPSASSFLSTQRRSNVYKAVSGVSFQETDSDDKKKPKKDNSKKERKISQPRSDSLLPPRKGHETKRSRSLTSMDPQSLTPSVNNSNGVPEITHPFAPVILYSGRQSRYTKSKDRRRAMSQNRAGLERAPLTTSILQATPPQPPRRTRSASRSRKSRSSTPQSSAGSSITTNSDLDSCRDNAAIYANHDLNKNLQSNTESSPHYQRDQSELTDFSVTDTDWRKYDAIVSEKLDTLLRNKDEPEGGYFSLERDECEDTSLAIADTNSGFQQDYYNESIYVSQVFQKQDTSLQSGRGSPSDRNECPEDEGLYEEIYFENTDHNDNLCEPLREAGLNNEKQVLAASTRIEQGPTSTVVYITNTDNIDQKGQSKHTSRKENNFEIAKSASTQFSPSSSKGWCNCCLGQGGLSSNFNHSSSCIQNKVSNLGAKISLINDSKLEQRPSYVHAQESVHAELDPETDGRRRSSPLKKNTSCVHIRKSKSTGHFEADIELSDIDFDMFAPKAQQRLTKHLQYDLNPPPQAHRRSRSNARKTEMILSPHTFKDVLRDAIFNPPDLETMVDGAESLVIREDQIITCITDSSSDESEDESGPSVTSPWLEATNDFEYVAFKEQSPSRNSRRRKKGSSLLPNFFNLHTSKSTDLLTKLSNADDVRIPERPSRRKKRSKSRKRNAT